MRIAWTPKAESDRESAIDYIASDSPLAAAGQLDRILAQVEELSRYPKLGRVGRVRGTRELVVAHTPFVLIYKAGKEAITILRVLHGAQQWPPKA